MIKNVALLNLTIYCGKIEESRTKTINLKYQDKKGMKNLSYHINQILYQIFLVLSISSKKHQTVTDNYPIRIYVNKIENRITFKIKADYYLELSTRETLKLFGIGKNEIAKDENVEDKTHSENSKVVLAYFNIASNGYQEDSRVLYTCVPNKSLSQFFGNFTNKFNTLRNL